MNASDNEETTPNKEQGPEEELSLQHSNDSAPPTKSSSEDDAETSSPGDMVVSIAPPLPPIKEGDPSAFAKPSQRQQRRRVKQLTSQTCATTDDGDFFCLPPGGSKNIEQDVESILSELTSRYNKRQENKQLENRGNCCMRSSWSNRRERWTALGCLSSIVVLVIRLLLDQEPTAYVIHSWVVFVDMVLIHCFTNSIWLSVGGECVTILFFLSFHFTKETVFELAETTSIAILCSLHMICSRSKALAKMEHLEEIVEEMSSRQEEASSLRSQGGIEANKEADSMLQEMEQGLAENIQLPHRRQALQRHSKKCCQHFFEHFLDGSAGVMYTSFLGLIISEILNYGNKSSY